MRKQLRIDPESKPVASHEDQTLILTLFGDKFNLVNAHIQVFEVMMENYLIDMLSGDPVKIVKQYQIPESPSRRAGGTGKTFEVNLISPRTILSPRFGQAGNFSGQVQEAVDQRLKQELQKPEAQLKSPEPAQKVVFNMKKDILEQTIGDELDIIESVCQAYSDGLTVHTTGRHPNYTRAQQLTKRGRTQFDQDEELRIINDIIFEGVFGVPGFLAWNALPLALAYYNKDFNVDFMANELLTYGDIVTQMFQNTGKSNPKFVLTPEVLRKWYNDFFRNFDQQERLFNVIKLPTAERITMQDLQRVAEILLKLHPGLSFLGETPQFEVLYAETVAMRILIEADTNFKGYLTVRDLKKINSEQGTRHVCGVNQQGNLLESLWESEFESDINKNLKCFSYEHFYVFYVTFWELDVDHDKLLTEADLERYMAGSVSQVAIKRAFELLVEIRQRTPQLYEQNFVEHHSRLPASQQELEKFLQEHRQQLFYLDFVRFLIYLENPDLDVSVDFWFEVCDLDGDGQISYQDFRAFYGQLKEKMEVNGLDLVDGQDVFCQILDYYKAKCGNADGRAVLTMQDIRTSESRGNIFSVMLHFQRFELFDMKDPYTIRGLGLEKTVWERYCRRQYDIEVEGVSGDGY